MTMTTMDWFKAVVALLILLGFVSLYGWMILKTLRSRMPPDLTATQIHVATALAGMIGATVAVMFGVELKKPPIEPAGIAVVTQAAPGPEVTQPGSAAQNVLTGVRGTITALYAIVYLAVGVVAIVIWLFRQNCPPVISNLATISLGLILGIAANFVR